ncbi:MAG: hypothetical protein JNM00_14445 [Flavobacteriales bacterium]|nr:hypothetical protein [Flavobacteriales bacterium]
MKRKWWLACLMLLALAMPAGAQDEDELLLEEEEEVDPWRGWSIGLNFGGYFASKKTGSFYNGLCGVGDLDDPNDIQCYTIAERLSADYFLRDWQDITNYYQIQSFSVPYDSYPMLMRYNPGVAVGINIVYRFDRYNAIVFNSNFSALKAADQFTLIFYGGSLPQNQQNDVRLFQIIGEEDRVNMNLGYRMGVESGPLANWYLQLGPAALFTTMRSNEIRVADRNYQLFLGATNPNQPVQYRPRTDVGLGGYASVGIEFFLKDKYTFDISVGMQNDNVILISYKERVWNKWLQLTFTI